MKDILGLFSIKFDVYLILYTFLICLFLTLLVFVIKKIKERKEYNILAEIIPIWSVSEEESYIVEKKKTLFGKEKEIKHFVEPKQRMMVTFFPAKLSFDTKTGNYFLTLKTKPKLEVYGITVDKLIPIKLGRFEYKITLIRYSPLDFKPVDVRIKEQKKREEMNVLNSSIVESATKAIEDVHYKLTGGRGKLEKWLPIIIIIIFGFFLLISEYLLLNNFSKSMERFVGSLDSFTNSLVNLSKYLAASMK